jgi:hypothetical protein
MCRRLRYSGGYRAGTGQPKGEKRRNMRCGKGHEHATVAEVRACYSVPASKPSVRTNKYAGTCVGCGNTVQPEQGILFRSMGVGSQRLGEGQWLVRHQPGDCEEARLLQDIKVMQPKQADKPRQTVNFKSIPQGYYATKSATGNNDLDFWFVRVPDDGKWAGYRFVRRIVGGRGPQQIHKSEQMAALRAILEAGVEAAGNLYADELGNCKKCGRDLTDDESRARRMGPICAGKAA